MKIAVIIVRILMGLLFLFASLAYFFQWVPIPEMEGNLKTFNEGLDAAGYLVPLVKAVELLSAIAFLSGLFVPLAVIVLFPVTVNILLVNLFLDPVGLPIAVPVLLAHLFLAYACRKHYRAILSARIQR